MGQEGFSSSSSLLYHRHSPSAVTAIGPSRRCGVGAPTADCPLTPRHLRTRTARRRRRRRHRPHVLLANDDVDDRLGRRRPVDARCTATPSATNCVYVQHGHALLESRVRTRSTVGAGRLRRHPRRHHTPLGRHGDGPVGALVIEARGHVAPPRSTCRRAASSSNTPPYCERDLRAPAEPGRRGRRPMSSVLVRDRARLVVTRIAPTRSTSSVGTAACTRRRSTSTTSNRSSDGCTSRRPSTRRSKAPASSCARSSRACSTSTPTRSRCRTTTPTPTPTRCSSTRPATS